MAMALQGLLVVELATQTPGKYCTCLLGDLGARVIRVERPAPPERGQPLTSEDLALNRNKRSIAVNLRTPGGQEVARRLVTGADVLVEGYRPGVARRLGLGYSELEPLNPRLIYCSLSSFGQDGPLSGLPAFDIVVQAFAGLLRLAAPGGQEPQPPALYVADLTGALTATIGVLAALVARQHTGRGQHVDVAMLEGLLSWAIGLQAPGAVRERRDGAGHGDAAPNAGYGVYRAGDGRHLVLGVSRPQSWEALCQLLGLPEYAASQGAGPREQEARVAAFQERFHARPRDEWLKLLSAHDVEAGPVNNLQEALEEPHVRQRGTALEMEHLTEGRTRQVGLPFRLSATPGCVRAPAPRPGQDTEAILEELGYSLSEVRVLREAGGV